jgi:hypothetical protein
MKTILTDNPILISLSAALTSAFLMFLCVGFSVEVLFEYGMALFIGVPFFVGIVTPVLNGINGFKTYKSNFKCTMLALLFLCLGLVVFAIEGVICLVMAAPISIGIAAIGTMFGQMVHKNFHSEHQVLTLLIIVLGLPALMSFEGSLGTRPTIYKVESSILIEAAIEEVWKEVISFKEIKDHEEMIFKIGIAYPKVARIEGEGVGAIRYCEFSTGAFVEPITKWEAPHLLAFDVEEQPLPMIELSPYDIDPAHLHGYFTSVNGQFALKEVNGGTEVVGTTWYYIKMGPEWYWKNWTDYIIHEIHGRVLNSIKGYSEE